MSFPAEKLSSLRQLIHSKINDLGVQDRIKECIEAGDDGGGGANEEHLLSQLRDKGVIDDIMASLKLNRDVADKTSGADPVDECTCEQENVSGGECFIREIHSVYISLLLCNSETKQAVCIHTSNGREGISGASAGI